MKAQAGGGATYAPSWYRGSYWEDYHIADFAASLGGTFVDSLETGPEREHGAPSQGKP